MLHSKLFIMVFAVSALAYYALFYYVIISSSHVFITNTPVYLIYAVSLSSALVLAASLYTARISISSAKRAASGSSASMLTVLSGSIISGCGCSTPILGSLLYPLGMNSIGVWGIVSFVNTYQNYLMGIIIAINVTLFFYYVRNADGSCRVK